MKALRLAKETSACLMSMRRRKNHKLAVLAIFKNEAHVLNEWVDHYLEEGATLVHLINNNSTDNFLEPLRPYINRGTVKLFHDTRLYAQRAIYNEHLQKLRQQSDWLLTCDLDEFVYARGDKERIVDVLSQTSPWVSSIQIPWKMFGSSGHIEQPREGVCCGFIQRANTDNLSNPHPCMPSSGMIAGKGIARSSRIRSLDVHSCTLIWGRRVLADGKGAKKGSFYPISEERLSNSSLHLNHYAIQSEELFRKVKMRRGDVNASEYAATRDMGYFRSYDLNELTDEELAVRSRLRHSRSTRSALS
jgi:hypothetical protein